MQINRRILIVVGFLLLLFSLIILFSKNYLLLGGEGNYFLNSLVTKDLYRYTWISTNSGVGSPNPILNYSFIIFDFFYWLQYLGISIKIINTLAVFLIYALPFTAVIWLLNRVLKVSFIISLFLSLFYILNPFSAYHLQGMMFFNVAPLFVLPLLFGVLYKYYKNSFKLFFCFGILSGFFSFSLANVPYLGILHIFLLFSLIIIHFQNLSKSSFSNLRLVLKNFFILEMSFLLFNAWWFINLVRIQLQDIKNFYTVQTAVSFASSTMEFTGIMGRIFSLKMMTPLTQSRGYFFSDYYNGTVISIISFIPFFLLLLSFVGRGLDSKISEKTKKYVLVFWILLIFFLNKGVSKPFEYVYAWMLSNIPLFLIFKSPLEKFSVLFVFLLTISLISVFNKKWHYYLFIIYLVTCSIPFLTLNFIPDFRFQDGRYISRKYTYKEGYFNVREMLNKSKLDYRALSLPGSLNYQVTMLDHDGNRYYQGMDPFVYSVNKPFIAAYSTSDPLSNMNSLYNNFSNESIEERLLNIYNVKRIVINKDIYPAFGFREREDIGQLTDIFEKNSKKQNSDSVSIFSRSDFLPHFYVPEQNIVSGENVDSLGKIATESGKLTRPAFYFSKQNKNDDLDSLKKIASGTPTLEFKKIDPTKYRMVVHGAKGAFSLVFSESFHNGWKTYLTEIASSPPLTDPRNDILGKYKILDGNEDDQASEEELKSFIDRGWITTLGDGKEKEIVHQKWDSTRNIWQGNEVFDYSERYNVDFISKNFQGTIQNDNLPSGQFYETLFKKPIDDNKNHLLVNGYANSWIINTNKMCGNDQVACIKNPDGSYDFEVIVEFWPQRLYYLGLFISLTTLISSLSYLIWTWVNSRSKNNEEFNLKRLI